MKIACPLRVCAAPDLPEGNSGGRARLPSLRLGVSGQEAKAGGEIGNWKFILIGLDISRGFLKERTGVEEYSYQVTCALTKIDQKNQYILYLNGKENEEMTRKIEWPENFKLKNIPQKRLWVHTRLAWSAGKDKVDVLFIPSQAMPLIHPENTVVTLHGLEYEYYPENYSWGRRLYLRFTTRYSLKHARKIIAVSENTKKDLIEMYGGDPEKIKVIYHGFSKAPSPSPSPSGRGRARISSLPAIASLQARRAGLPPLPGGRVEGVYPSERGNYFPPLEKAGGLGEVLNRPLQSLEGLGPPATQDELARHCGRGLPAKCQACERAGEVLTPFLLAIGRLEARKNIVNLIKAFALLKKQGWPGQLVLAGKAGYGYAEIKKAILASPCKKDIIEKGYVSDAEKWRLLSAASVFVFPSLYEGFGLPILEAFAAQIPVVASQASSIPEVGGESCIYFDPQNIEEMSEKMEQVLKDKNLQQELVEAGTKRLKNFSWEKCARETLELLSDH